MSARSPPRQPQENAPDAVASERVFADHRFYLARTLSTARRDELRALILQLGGQVVEQLGPRCVEIVEREQLRAGHDWVAADFVTDAAARGALPNVVEYLAPMEVLPMFPGQRRQRYTKEEDAHMLQFLKDNYPKYYSHTSTPMRVWEDAANRQVTSHTAQSMHEHWRKKLVKLPERQRSEIMGLLKATANGQTQKAARSHPMPATQTVAPIASKPSSPEHVIIKAEPRSAKRRHASPVRSRSASATRRAKPAVDDHNDEIEGRARKRVKKVAAPADATSAGTPPRQQRVAKESSRPVVATPPQAKEKQAQATRSTPPKTPPSSATRRASRASSSRSQTPKSPSRSLAKTLFRSPARATDTSSSRGKATNRALTVAPTERSPADTPQNESDHETTAPEGDSFTSYWEKAVTDPRQREDLQRFFVARKEATQPNGVTSAQDPQTPRADRPRASSESAATPSHAPPSRATPSQPRESRRSSISTPARRRQSDPGLAALINRISSPMVPTPSRGDKSSVVRKTATLPQMNHAIARLQAATGHSEQAVCSALFWASGVPRVALDFLRGRHDATARSPIWSQRDDQILADLVRPDVTLEEVAQAKERGAFRLMSVDRRVEDIHRRIQFLV
ncbi:hypothetical protein PINS_up007139 [Pythium insidiosum]|nr:hypothetical protein PINS_up007139 [Pythium insidiosum]